MIPGPLVHTCYCSECPDDNYYLSMPEKVCLECEEYFHASEDGKNCTRCGKDGTSPTDFEIIDENGFCTVCPAGEYPAPILDNCDTAAGEICFPTQCKKDTCDPTLYKVFNTHGQLIVDCPANTFVNDDCSACITECDPMPANHIWDTENRGYCIECGDYMVPNADNTECVIWPGDCTATQKWFQGETGPICKDCPVEFEQCPDNQYMCCRTQCDSLLVAGACNNFFIAENECKECDAYMVPSLVDQSLCVEAEVCANPRDIMDGCGVCSTCPEYTYPNANRTECISDEPCQPEGEPAASWLKKDGTCEFCPEGYLHTTNEDGDNMCYKVTVISSCPEGFERIEVGDKVYCGRAGERNCPWHFIQDDGFCSRCPAD